MSSRLEQSAKPAGDPAPWTNVYGVARSLLALGTLVGLVFDHPDTLFRPLGREILDEVPLWSARISLFSVLGGEWLWLARLIGIAILLVVASGWRPRFTGVLHWWVTHSFAISCIVVEGGDQIAAILTLLLVPVTSLDPRRWHWQPAPVLDGRFGLRAAAVVASSALLVVRIQVAMVYFVASTSKLAVTEWRNGTALYYWFLHPVFGLPDYLQPMVLPFLGNGVAVTLATWGAVALEAVLFAGLFMDRRVRRVLLPIAVAFHLAIAVVHGLFSFFLAMTAALVLFLRPHDRPFEISGLSNWIDRARSVRWASIDGLGRILPRRRNA